MTINWPLKNAEFETVTQYHEFSSIIADFEVWVPKNGHRIVLMGMIVTGEATNNVSFKGLLRGEFSTITLEDIDQFEHGASQPIWIGRIDEKLVIDTSTVGQVFITIYGYEES